MRLRETSNPEKQATVLWLSGYRSDMAGSKAVEVDALAERLGLDASGSTIPVTASRAANFAMARSRVGWRKRWRLSITPIRNAS